MGFLARIFGAVPAEERKGIHLDRRAPRWKVSQARDLPGFLRALVDLVPPESVLYLEGGSPPKDLLAFFQSNSAAEQSHVAMGTIWPRPLVYHLPATRVNLTSFADLAQRCAAPEAAIHLHVYQQGRVLLQWFDAFDAPFYVSKEVPEERIQKFCATLGLTYETDKEGG